MFENILMGNLAMAGELPRIALAIAGTAAAAWYDVTNQRNVPNKLLYAFLGIAFLCALFFYQPDVTAYGIGVAAAVFIIGYLFYKMGYIGGADVYVLASIALLVPLFPSWIAVLFNFPVVFSIIITSGVLFALYMLLFIITNVVLKGAKGRYEYLLLLPAYLVLIYFIHSSQIFGLAYVATISVLVLSSIVFLVYKESMTAAMAKKVKLSEIDEEDVAVLEMMPELAKKYNIRRLLDEKELARLRKLKVKEIFVYKELPPFLPFVLAGLLISVTLGDLLMYSLRI